MKSHMRVLAALSMLVGSVGLLSLPTAGAVTNQISSVSPASAPQGAGSLLVTFTLSATPPPPATTVPVNSILLGSIPGVVSPHTNQFILSARFNLPGNEPPGTKDVTITFAGGFVGRKAAGFTVTPAPLAANFSATPTQGIAPLTVNFSDTSSGTVSRRLWEFGDLTTSTEAAPAHTFTAAGTYTVSLTVADASSTNTLTRIGCITVTLPPTNGAYLVVDTGVTNCHGNSGVISPPAPGEPFHGQDAQIPGSPPAYRDNGDGTVSDLVTGLMWVRARGTRSTWEAARTNAAACAVGGYSDWRMPTIKEIYSLIQFTGVNGTSMTSTADYIPFIDTNHFEFAYGSGVGGERVIDCQDWSATAYVSTTMNGDATIFGVNFADGRIKGYPKYIPASGGTTGQVMYVRYVRGNPGYGVNNFVNHGDGTISDKATRLMWDRNDSGAGLNWSNALAWAQARNAVNHLGHNDWRLPNVKELQSIVDYTRSPNTTASAAISPVFNCSAITNEGGAADFACYWSGTTHRDGSPSPFGAYVCFGRALGLMNGSWLDVHGAGAQRSDPKSGSPADYPNGHGPQGDAVRIYNHVRLVRDLPVTNSWRFAFVGDTHTPLSGIPAEIAASIVGDDARFLIVAGDLVQSGSGASTNTLLDQLEAWRTALAPADAAGVGIYVVRGNHEDDVNNGLVIWTNFFSGARAMPGNGPAGESGLTYSFSWSNALFIGLDNYSSIHRIHQPWLQQQLGANLRPHLFTFGHEPAFKAFHTDCLDDYPADRNTFWNSLAAAGARVYLCGHDHFLNLARIDDGDGDPANDLYQCIVGTGGTTNWPGQRYNYNGTNSPYTPVNLAGVTNTHGYLLVEISGPGPADLGVTLTWKQRIRDDATGAFLYVATTNGLAYTAVNRHTGTVGDGISDWWRAQYFGGSGATTNAASSAASDPDADGADNYQEYLADSNPTNALSFFHIENASHDGGFKVFFQSSASRTYTLYHTASLAGGIWTGIPSQTGVPGSGGVDMLADPSPGDILRFYRIGVELPQE